MDIKTISFPDKNDVTIKTVNEAYTSLYNSLGVEPGLLGKTTIGKNLNKKFRDDSIDAKIIAIKHLPDGIEKQQEKIQDTSPRILQYTLNDIRPTSEIKDTLWKIIRKVQYQDNLTTEEVIEEISEYLKYYANNYHIIKKEGIK